VIDTLGLQNGLATLRTSGGSGQPYVLTYNSPAGPASVTTTFKSPALTVQTNFGCPNIVEYAPQTGQIGR